ncbi:hypothetical protein HPB51_026997 [Rhipicephalus microplus]|uniref:Uncharacterized protein n=1 Tax=Rhipicephalus microplus TaxID=6941 RepID=A0A9J6D1A2_RHIMP|nr:hypothetical protein HPB51_026997 [Rhipicephalus microplus]
MWSESERLWPTPQIKQPAPHGKGSVCNGRKQTRYPLLGGFRSVCPAFQSEKAGRKSLELDGSLTFLINFLRRARPPIQGLSEEIARTLHLIESGIALALVSGSMQSGPNRGAGSPTINFKARAPSGFACRLSPGEVSAFVRVASLPIRCRRCGDYVGHPRHAAAKRERWQRSAAAVADVVDAVGPSRLTKAAAASTRGLGVFPKSPRAIQDLPWAAKWGHRLKGSNLVAVVEPDADRWRGRVLEEQDECSPELDAKFQAHLF